MLVGEQPGDKEDLAGKPFVGPAGRILDQALQDAGIAREETFVTNAVKHFKHEMRGKRRLHKRPNSYEIDRCRIWLEHERKTGQTIGDHCARRDRGTQPDGKDRDDYKFAAKPLQLADGTMLFVTVHPSSLLRIKDKADKRAAYKAFVADLKKAAAKNKNR